MSGTTKPTELTASEFADRVMSAIEVVPAPTPTRTLVAALRTRSVRDALSALWVAWHLGTVRSWHVAPRVRARSFALVLAVTSVLATGGLATAAAVNSVVLQRGDPVPVSAPSGSNDEQGPAGNGQAASHGPDEIDESPTTSAEPGATDHGDGGTTVDSSHGPGDDQPTTRDAQPDDADDDGAGHDADQAADDHDGEEPDEADDGPDGEDAPAATDDHSGSDGGGELDESNDPDGGDATDSSDAGDATDSSGWTDGDGDGELESGSGEAEPGGD